MRCQAMHTIMGSVQIFLTPVRTQNPPIINYVMHFGTPLVFNQIYLSSLFQLRSISQNQTPIKDQNNISSSPIPT